MRRNRGYLGRLFLAVGLLLCGLGQVHGDTTAGGIQETRLPNGLVVLTKEVHAAPVVCTYVWYRVGSRNEVAGITGVSHQLEHMLFKGTKKQFPNPGYIDLLIGRYGGVNNASTTTDTTSYYLLIPADQLDLALRIEADRMTQAAIDPQQLTAEKTVVLSELEGGENDNGSFLYDNTQATAFQYHPYHYPIIGTKWDVTHYTRQQVYDYYRQFYAPNNATLVIVGDFDTKKVLPRVRELWKTVQPSRLPAQKITPEPPQRGERRIMIRRAGATAYLDLMYHIPAAAHPDMPALDVLATALTGGRSSRLYRALVETQLATGVGASANENIDPGTFDLSVSARAGVSPETIEKTLLAEIEKVRTERLADKELQKAKNQTRAGFVFGQESVETQAGRIGFYQTVTGDWKNLTRYLPRIQKVTADDVQRVARKYLTVENRTVGTFLPTGEKAPPGADSGGKHEARYRPNASGRSIGPLPTGASISVRVPTTKVPKAAGRGAEGGWKPIQKRLSNGLTVILFANHANPSITVGGFVQTGSVQDPPGKHGLAGIMADLLTRGTTTRSSQQIAEETEFVGASLAFGAGRERMEISAAMLTQDFATIMGLLADCLTHPTFPAEELEKVRGETLTALKEQEDDTASVAVQRLYAALYPANSVYAHEPMGDTAGVKAIEHLDVVAFYRAAVRPERATLVIVGDIQPEPTLQLLERTLGAWRGEGEAMPAYSPESAASPGKPPAPITVTLADKSQNDVAMGVLGLSRKAPDYEAAYLMNLILGGDEFVGRVGKRVRDTEGLAYYAYTAFAPGLTPGPWLFRAGVNPKNVPRAIASAREEVAKMASKGVTPSELAWAKDNSIGGLRLSLATNGGIAGQLEHAAYYGLGLDYAQRYPAIIRRISLRDVNTAARKYLHPQSLTVVVAGPPVPGVKSEKPPK